MSDSAVKVESVHTLLARVRTETGALTIRFDDVDAILAAAEMHKNFRAADDGKSRESMIRTTIKNLRHANKILENEIAPLVDRQDECSRIAPVAGAIEQAIALIQQETGN